MTRHASRGSSPGLLPVAVLLPLAGMLLVAQAAYDSLVLWVLFVVVGFGAFVALVTTAASALRDGTVRDGGVSAADAARLDELEPLPPTAGDEGERQ
ncbi:hypothetical protein GCM10023196_020940 [Actinoallomurus vinaceus]|uniref:Uncharacterized protein n=1 Tax=Actinoallomurus vinaceus TaxID=1080074 RepID=A0ABP8U639_9ACTN